MAIAAKWLSPRTSRSDLANLKESNKAYNNTVKHHQSPAWGSGLAFGEEEGNEDVGKGGAAVDCSEVGYGVGAPTTDNAGIPPAMYCCGCWLGTAGIASNGC